MSNTTMRHYSSSDLSSSRAIRMRNASSKLFIIAIQVEP